MSSSKPPRRLRSILESRMEGRANLITMLFEHRRALERMALEHTILADDRSAILTCATFAYTELLWEASRTADSVNGKPGGGVEVIFCLGTKPGTVSLSPRTIPA